MAPAGLGPGNPLEIPLGGSPPLVPAIPLALLAVLALAALALMRLILAMPLTLARMLALARMLCLLLAVIGLIARVAHARQPLARSAGTVHGGGEALAHILHVHVGHRQFAAADARPLAVIHRAQHAIIMVGVLQEILRGDA